MSSPPVSVRKVLLFLLCLGSPASAVDLGESVSFPNPGVQASNASVIYESGQSGAILKPWNTVLFNGMSPALALTFEVSRQAPAGSWSDWRCSKLKRFPNGRFWGRAEFALAAGPLRIRAIAPGLIGKHSVEIYGVEVFDSSQTEMEASSQEAVVPLAALAVATLTVHGRQTWNANPPKQAYQTHIPDRMTLHHTDGPQTMSLAESEAELRFIQDFHQNARGWIDIGYHFLIDGAGNIFEGRPEGVVGAHTQGHNNGNIGIALLGTYHPPKNDPWTPEQSLAIMAVGRYLAARHGVAAGTLQGHRDYNQTDCPGDIVYTLLPELRRRMEDKLITSGSR